VTFWATENEKQHQETYEKFTPIIYPDPLLETNCHLDKTIQMNTLNLLKADSLYKEKKITKESALALSECF
jgi:hypothetical protein